MDNEDKILTEKDWKDYLSYYTLLKEKFASTYSNNQSICELVWNNISYEMEWSDNILDSIQQISYVKNTPENEALFFAPEIPEEHCLYIIPDFLLNKILDQICILKPKIYKEVSKLFLGISNKSISIAYSLFTDELEKTSFHIVEMLEMLNNFIKISSKYNFLESISAYIFDLRSFYLIALKEFRIEYRQISIDDFMDDEEDNW